MVFKHLIVFDFDKTSVLTPEPEFGMEYYFQKFGVSWPHKGWWGRLESVDTSIFDIQARQDVLDFNKQIDSEAKKILLTGRILRFRDSVIKICSDLGYKFDDYYFNNSGLSTFLFKKSVLDSYILSDDSQIEELTFLDDREDHFDLFNELFDSYIKSGKIKKYTYKLVK